MARSLEGIGKILLVVEVMLGIGVVAVAGGGLEPGRTWPVQEAAASRSHLGIQGGRNTIQNIYLFVSDP